jgi:hypothetical protein
MWTLCDGEAEGGVQFVDRAVGFDAEVVFWDFAAVEEGGEAEVALFGVDFHKGSLIGAGRGFQLLRGGDGQNASCGGIWLDSAIFELYKLAKQIENCGQSDARFFYCAGGSWLKRISTLRWMRMGFTA